MGGDAVLQHPGIGGVAVPAALGRLLPRRQAGHGMAVAAGHAGLEMHVGGHLQVGLAVDERPPLVAQAVLPGGAAEVVGADEVPLVAAVAGLLDRTGQSVPLAAVAVGAGGDMAGSAVLGEKVPIDAAEGFPREALLRLAGGHPLLEDPAVTLVAADTTGAADPRRRRVGQQLLAVAVAGGAGNPLVGSAHRDLVAVGAVLSRRRQGGEQKQPQGDAGSFPAGHNRVPSGRWGPWDRHGSPGRGWPARPCGSPRR